MADNNARFEGGFLVLYDPADGGKRRQKVLRFRINGSG